MTPQDIIQHFGSQADAARALCVARQVVHNWTVRGEVPQSWQAAVEAMTDGALKRDKKLRAQAVRAA